MGGSELANSRNGFSANPIRHGLLFSAEPHFGPHLLRMIWSSFIRYWSFIAPHRPCGYLCGDHG